MRFNPKARIDQSQYQDLGGSGGGGGGGMRMPIPLPGGGGKIGMGTIIVLVLFFVVTQCLGGGGGTTTQQQQPTQQSGDQMIPNKTRCASNQNMHMPLLKLYAGRVRQMPPMSK